MERTKVKTLHSEGGYILVEWYGENSIQRASVSQSLVDKNDTVNSAILRDAIRYGVDWDNFPLPQLANLSFELRRRGVWTQKDARANPEKVRAAVIAATKNIVSTIIGG